MMLAIPGLLIAIGVAAAIGRSLTAVMIAIGVVNVPIFARLLRGSMLAQRESDYVLAARALGVRRGRIVLGHIVPNSIAPVIVQATLALATAIIDAAGLAYLGLGSSDPGVPEWGRMLAETQSLLQNAPHAAIFPGLAIVVSCLGFYLLGEGLRETIGLVGESGCGKSVTSLAILGLLPRRGVRVSGSVRFGGRELLKLSDAELREIRGRDIAMVFQDPMTSLNPVLTIGRQITEVLQRHFGKKGAEAEREAVSLLDAVGIPAAPRRVRDYPHQLSGGMRQRAMIAMALACQPKLLIADEPTTALDVTIQAQILDLLRAVIAERDTALLLIHDLGVVAGMCETVHVMYAGRFVESADRYELFARPRHPYTAGLLASVPRLDQPRAAALNPIKGSARDTIPWTSACAFAPRCGNSIGRCTAETPELAPDGLPGSQGPGVDHLLRCFNPVGAEAAEAR